MSNRNDQRDCIVVAIDGPSASGKSTVSRLTARELGFCYVDSGAFYRGMTWKALRDGVACRDAAAVAELLARVHFDLFLSEGQVRFTIDGEDPWHQLRSEAVAEHVSDIAAHPEVRRYMVARLQATTAFGNLVMEGRDIGTVVFPDAPFKFYLDADPDERARRRHQELVKGEADDTTVDNVRESLSRRDTKDTTRKTAPLQIALGAQVIDSTAMSVEDVVRHVVAQVRAGIRA